MQAIERKYEIEMKIEKEQNNLHKLKELSKRSSDLSVGVGAVLGTCELRLQQLEKSVLPLYGDTAKLQQRHLNLERTVQALDHLIGYYLVARELADLINNGPNVSSPEALNEYLEALDRLTEAQVYFQKNNPQSIELENISSLYNSGIGKLEAAISELLARYSRPMPLNTLLNLMEQDDSAVVEFMDPNDVGVGVVRAGAAWLWDARGTSGITSGGTAAVARGPAALRALNSLREHLRSSTPTNAGERSKPVHRSDSSVRKTSSRLHKAIEKKANKMIMLASHTLEQSTGLALGHRKSFAIPEGDQTGAGGESATGEEGSGGAAEQAAAAAAAAKQLGALALGVARLLRAEHAALLAVAPLAALPAALAAIAAELFRVLHNDAERVWSTCRRCASSDGGGEGSARGAGAAAVWTALSSLIALRNDVERALSPAPMAPYDTILNTMQSQGLRTLEDWVETLRTDSSPGPVDGTVQQLAAETLALLQRLANHQSIVGAALSTEAAYCRAPVLSTCSVELPKRALSLYMRKVLAQLNHTIRNKSEQYNDPALRAIFRLNNAHYLLLGLQRNGLIEILSIVEPDSEQNYQEMIQEHRKAYLQCWSRIVGYITLEEPLPAKLRDKDKQMLKDKFSNFNRDMEEAFKAQRGYSVPDAELRESLKRDNKERLLPVYTRLHSDASAVQNMFTRHPDKYLKYSPHQLASVLDSFFDAAA